MTQAANLSLGGLILGTAALLLHLALVLAAAPLVSDARLAAVGRPGGLRLATAPAAIRDWLLSPWRALGVLVAKMPVRATNASPVALLAPVAALAATLVAACLVPSFGIGMLTAPLSDLPTILALLALARGAILLGALDAGIGAAGLAAVALATRSLLAVPGCALAVFTLAVVAGSTGLEPLLAGVGAGAAVPGATEAVVLAAAGLGLAAIAAGDDLSKLAQDLSGPDLALVQVQHGLQRLVWIELVTALLLPRWLAAAQSNPVDWLLGLLGWAVRVGVGCLVLEAWRRLLGVPDQRQRRVLAGVATLVGLLAPLLLLAGRGGE